MIEITEILGTDSVASGRIIINDNFSILLDEINNIETFLNPTDGTLGNLNDISTERFKVGLNTTKLEITDNSFDIFVDLETEGIINSKNHILRNNQNPVKITEVVTTGTPNYEYNLGTPNLPPPYTIEKVANELQYGTTPVFADITLNLFDGFIGQELIIIYETGFNNSTGASQVIIKAGVAQTTGTDGSLLIDKSSGAFAGNNAIVLNNSGQSVHLLCILDSTGNPVWVIIGGDGYTFAVV